MSLKSEIWSAHNEVSECNQKPSSPAMPFSRRSYIARLINMLSATEGPVPNED